MKNRIHKIMGVGIALVIAMALVMGFVAPAAANPGETINEWYKFDYPQPGADGDWLYDPSILRVGELTEAIDGTLYAHVRRCVPDVTFRVDLDNPGTLTVSEFGTTNTGMVTADINGYWEGSEEDLAALEAFLPTDFTANLDLWGEGGSGTACISGTITETGLNYQGSIEGDSTLVLSGTWDVRGGRFNLRNCGRYILLGWWVLQDFGVWTGTQFFSGSVNGLGDAIFKSTDEGRTWEETDYPGGWVVDMAPSSVDEDTLYVADGHYVYKTDDAGDEWDYLGRDSLETAIAGDCGIPACCYCWDCSEFHQCEVCPSCGDGCNEYPFNCPITSISVGYDDDDNPYVFIGTRQHCSGVDLDDDNWLDPFPGDVYYLGEAGYPANWTSLNLSCYGNGTYDAIAVGCAPDWADTKETYVVVSTTDDDGDGNTWTGAGDSQTHVVYTKGTVCGWYEYAELLWDCTTPFASKYASRIAFPDDWEDTETLFVGVVDCADCWSGCIDDSPNPWYGCGGDVYMVMDGDCIDMNVKGISSGCIGEEPVDICSLDIEGDTEEARLIAGDYCCNKVYCSEDGGWSWDASDKDPTGGGYAGEFALTHAIWYEDTALAATAGCECAVSMCCGEDYPCEFWDQISLISTSIECVRSIGHSPGYVCGDSETMFMLTNWNWEEYWDDEFDCCYSCQESRRGGGPPRCYRETQSLWRHDGEYWERVYSCTIADHETRSWQIFQNLQVSPDFNDTGTVYLWNGCFEMWRTTDTGCSWDKLTFPCAPRPCINAAVVIDEDTVIAGGCYADDDCCEDAAGYVYKTTRHGSRPWDEYEFDDTHEGDVISFALEPGYEDPGTVLLGDDESRVYISEDGGETWDLISGAKLPSDYYDTWVAFDPAYATNHIIYAAAGPEIHRCIIDPDEDWADQEWEVICDHGGYASGIQAVGDTALYVTDRESTDECGDEDPCCDDGVPDEGGVLRSLNPDADDADDVIFERVTNGLPLVETDEDKAQLTGLWLTCDTSEEGCAENVLWALEAQWADCENIWVYEDTLAAPVTLIKPLDEQKLGETDSATLSWNELCGADCYEVALWKYCAECPDEKMDVVLDFLDCAPGACCIACGPGPGDVECECEIGECTCTEDTCIVVDELEPGTEYHWQVRVCACKPFLSKWSEERTFKTALMGVPFEGLSSPACGDTDIILTPNFTWGPVDGATGYDIEIATTETFTAGVIRGSSTVNAWVCPEELDYSTTYYWRVRAKKDGVYSDWMICMFTTMAEPEEPPPPVEIQEAPPAPQINIPPAEMVTPNWIYAIVAIGAALCIVVIVLIVRTRKPPA
jgi:hypothetical protein